MLINKCAEKRTLAGICFLNCLLITFLFLSFQPRSWAQENSQFEKDFANISIETLLQKFVHNGPSQIFEGTFIYLYEDQVQTIKVRRTVNDKGLVIEEFIPQDD